MSEIGTKMSIKDMPDKLALDCWHAVADTIGWEETSKPREGQPHPKEIIIRFIEQAYQDGLEDGANNPYA